MNKESKELIKSLKRLDVPDKLRKMLWVDEGLNLVEFIRRGGFLKSDL